MLSQLHPRIHQIHWTDPGYRRSMNEEVDEFIFPEGDKFGDKFDIRLKASSLPTSSSTNGDNFVGGGLSSNATLSDSSTSMEEAISVEAYNEALIMEERFLKQKAKVDWLKVGDSNSAYFHKAVKSRTSRSRIDVVTSVDGTLFENDKVAEAFVSHYEKFLGQPGGVGEFDSNNLFKSRLDDNVALHMVRIVSRQEVKDAIFSMALIPKVRSPARVTDYRPISCCNVLFKCISKIIANRIKESLKDLVCPNQSAFVPGRCISDNILLTQELMHNYHLDRGSPRCAFKVDIQKAYDTGKRGLLQGDPLSPYLFTMVMELINLCFADDLFVFAYGDINSTCIIKEALDEFTMASGLTPSLPKSTAYFCNVLNHVKIAILNVFPFEEGRLPVKYLGVPLVSSRFLNRDYKELVEKVQARIQDWKNKSLSIAGRLQLVKSVIGSMHIFWALVFMLPSRILCDLEQIMRSFLWSQDMRRGQFKVAWEVVCLPKDEGGLGLRRLDHFNKALMVSHIWKLLSLKESL
ncbi:hypothetical protein Tco_1195906 [Tanacetum coccineum]